ncbi:MAG: hypothetical protein ABI877_22715, partial [Gemmatimonadaceae bacterium]
AISTVLITGVREALALLPRNTRVELHLVSPVMRGEVDAATLAIRAQWPDSLFVHRVPVREEVAPVPSADVDLDEDDPVGASARLALRHETAPGSASIRVRRGAISPTDSVWGRGGGRVLVKWPMMDASGAPDTIAAVATTQGAVVGFFTSSPIPQAGEPIAWWSDGSVAAREVPNGNGCIRVIGFSPSSTGDGALSFGMQRLMRRLAAPCGPVVDASVVSAQEIAALVARPQGVERPAAVLPVLEHSWLAVWLLLAALVMLLAEWYLRDRPEQVARLSAGRVR